MRSPRRSIISRLLDNPESLLHKFWYWRRVVRLRCAFDRLVRRIRYGAVPTAGWGHGWRILVFRYNRQAGNELHVLAPVKGLTFDWETMRPYTREIVPWPAYDHQEGVRVGTLGWAGHHTFAVIDGYGPQRLSMGSLIPGEFEGGTECSLLLIAVRPTSLEIEPSPQRYKQTR